MKKLNSTNATSSKEVKQHPECLGDPPMKGGVTRDGDIYPHSVELVETKDGNRWYCPRCDYLVDTLYGVSAANF